MWERLRNWRRLDTELDEEIRSHLAMAAEERMDQGETPRGARFGARRELGNELLVRERTRETWGWTTMERLGQDLRHTFRQMKRSPGFTAIAVLTLALGLGATTAMFSIVNGVLLEPLKFRDPARLYIARTIIPRLAQVAPNVGVNARHFYEWRKSCRSCDEVALAGGVGFTLTGTGESERLPGLQVSFNFFKTLGVQPSIGRDFLPEEELPGRSHVVILSNGLWQTHFVGDRSIVGRKIVIDGEAYEVIGVMPPTLHLPRGRQWGALFAHDFDPVIFRPLGFDASQVPGIENLTYGSVIRLKPGVTPGHAIGEMNAMIAEFARLARKRGFDMKATLIPFRDQVTVGARSILWLLMGIVAAVLLVVCVNVGNLMLVRTTSRSREAGIRMALGSSRSRLFGLVIDEALVLVVIGGVLGLLFAYVGLRIFTAAVPSYLPRVEDIKMDWRVMAFAALAVAFSTLLCAFVPAWRLSKTEPQESLKAGSVNATENGRKLQFREVMVGVEVTLSTVLLIVAGLLMLSFFRLMRVDRGFEVEHIISQGVSLISPEYREDAARNRFIDAVLRNFSAIPGVRSVAVTNQVPLQGENWVNPLSDPDHGEHEAEFATANFRLVSPDYWKTMGIALKQGRFIQESDRNRRVALLSEKAAQYLWPRQNPLGRHVRAIDCRNCGPVEVVGIVADVRESALEKQPPMMVYEPYWLMGLGGPSFVLRTYAEPAAVIASMREMIASVDPEVPITQTETMEQILDESVNARKVQMELAAAFAMSALVLASLGIYGVISFTVARRTPELGIRIALGARTKQVTAMVLWQGMFPVVIGLATGLVFALLVSRLIASELFEVTPRDPLTMLGVVVLFLIVAV